MILLSVARGRRKPNDSVTAGAMITGPKALITLDIRNITFIDKVVLDDSDGLILCCGLILLLAS